jgi:hypothetical protein
MNRQLTVLVLDDSPKTALAPINLYLGEGTSDPDRFILRILTDPAKLSGYLDGHPEVDVVLVDVDFELTTTRTCLTAFMELIRRNGPQAIGLAASQYGRTLFPFAICQLLPPPARQTVMGWTYKDDKDERGYPELIRILDSIASDHKATKPPRTLERCMPDAARATGEFLQEILPNRLDVRLWSMMSATHYDAKNLALSAGISTSAVRQRFDKYLNAIQAFEAAMNSDPVHPVGAQAVLNLPSRQMSAAPGTTEPRQRAVEAFAQAHRKFFQAPELEDIVVARDLRRSKQAGKRGRRRTVEPWWKPTH